MNILEAKYVTLSGNITVGGMNTRNFDSVRDECVLHLHQETGGVFVTRGSDSFYIPPVAVQSVELTNPVQHREPDLTPKQITHKTQVPKAMLAPTAPPAAEDVAKGARNLADEVLAELNDAPTDASPTTRRKRK